MRTSPPTHGRKYGGIVFLTRGSRCRALSKGVLGGYDLTVTNACIGTMMMGSTNTEQEACAQLDFFRGAGGNFIDTAETYPVPVKEEYQGLTEEIVGRWLKTRGCRNEFVIATKVAGRAPPSWADRSFIARNRLRPRREDAGPICMDKRNISEAITGSLRRLQVDEIDLFQVHWPDRYVPLFGKYRYEPPHATWEPVPFADTVQAIGAEIKKGRIRHWGLSNETAYGVTRMCESAKTLGVPLPVSIQNDYSICDRSFDSELAEACSAYGMHLLSYGSLNGGFLSGKYLGGLKPSGARHSKHRGFQHRYTSPRVEAAVLKYKAVADSQGLSLTQLAIAWVASRWHIGSVITGQTNVHQLEEYLSAFDVTLGEAVLEQIDQINLEHRNPNWSD